MVVLAQWRPRRAHDFPSEIPFWVKVIGVPLDFWTEPTFESICGGIGKLEEIDLDNDRVLVVVDGSRSWFLKTTVDFKGGEFYDKEEAPVSLRYERLFGYCKLCYNLSHDEGKCSLNKNKKEAEKQREAKETNGNRHEGGRHEDRARSYKGVVINGNEGKYGKEKENRGYQGKGKGKGKLVEEDTDHKRGRHPEKDQKRYTSSRAGNRKEEGSPRHRSLRWEAVKNHQEPHSSLARGIRRELSPGTGMVEAAGEEGEIQVKSWQLNQNKGSDLEASAAFREELLKTQGPPFQVVPDQGVKEKEGAQGKEHDEGMGVEAEDVEMELFNQEMEMVEEENGGEAGDEILSFTDEEIEEGSEVQGMIEIPQVKEQKTSEAIEKEEEMGKKQVTKKRLFKPTIVTAGTSRMRMVQALTSPRKRTSVKGDNRKGEGNKQADGKGALNPKPDLPKP